MGSQVTFKYKGITQYNYYDGPTMLTASAEIDGVNDIFWLVWDEELGNQSWTYRVFQLSGVPTLSDIGRYVETIHESQLDRSELQWLKL